MRFRGYSWTAGARKHGVSRELEVAGVLLDDGRLRVIHAMPMRESYRSLYEEAKRWRL